MPACSCMTGSSPAASKLQLDLHIHARRQIELHQRVHCLRRRVDDIDQALMRPHLELLAALLVDMRRTVHRIALDTSRERNRPAYIRARALRRIDNLLRGGVEHTMIECLQPDADRLACHVSLQKEGAPPRTPAPILFNYFMMLATTPAPTVRPPSRIAKRSFSSMAIGTIKVISIEILSPGITISVPAGNVTTPVTSVVRK